MIARFATPTLVAALMTVSGIAQADSDYGDAVTVRARVIASTPITSRINEPRKECWTETVGYETRRSGDNGTAGSVIGAIAGGLLGAQVGKGDGRVAAAAVGAATGAVVGGKVGANNGGYTTTEPRQIERCRVTDNYRVVVTGYDVRYSFEGREYTTNLPYAPGKWITLEVNHRVIDDGDRRGGDRYDDRDDGRRWRD